MEGGTSWRVRTYRELVTGALMESSTLAGVITLGANSSARAGCPRAGRARYRYRIAGKGIRMRGCPPDKRRRDRGRGRGGVGTTRPDRARGADQSRRSAAAVSYSEERRASGVLGQLSCRTGAAPRRRDR